MSGGTRLGTYGRHFLWLVAAAIVAAGASGRAGADVNIEKTAFQGWPNCYRVSNGTVEFIATTDVGPRIISFGFTGGANLFFVREDFAGQTGGTEWKNYGGHRVWHAPEDKVRTYEPDNAPGGGAGHRQRAAADHAAWAAERDPEGDRDHAGPGRPPRCA